MKTFAIKQQQTLVQTSTACSKIITLIIIKIFNDLITLLNKIQLANKGRLISYPTYDHPKYIFIIQFSSHSYEVVLIDGFKDHIQNYIEYFELFTSKSSSHYRN